MTSPDPAPRCPICGLTLRQIITGDDDTPPWLCPDDARGWWPSELTAQARAALRPQMRDFGAGDQAAAVEQATRAAIAQQRARNADKRAHPTHPDNT